MRLVSVRAKNFRTLEDITVSFSGNYCTISGRNNAGKSGVIRLLLNLLERDNSSSWYATQESNIDYREDKTKWVKGGAPIEISCEVELSREDDPALLSFIEKQAQITVDVQTAQLIIEMTYTESDRTTKIQFAGKNIDERASKDILEKIKASNVLFTHNSASSHGEIFFGRGKARAFYEVMLSAAEQKELSKAEKAVQQKIRKLAKDHKTHLNEMLGKLTERYDVEFSTLEGFATSRLPLGINLKDKTVEVPLTSWGSGTQNRTWVFMSILQANRIKTAVSSDERTTPIVLIEEPESFLHPSAQAEFGRLLHDLSRDLGIQIIVSTHSPYMLNQSDPSANILLQRKSKRSALRETEIVSTSGKDWMAPFAEHLGVTPGEFAAWERLFGLKKTRALLVEGDIDKEYFEHMRSRFGTAFGIPEDVEIVAYGGKDALKNTVLLRFSLRRLDQYFITFDLDSEAESKKALERLGLKDGESFLAIGTAKPGKQAIEGLLPDSVLNKVHGRCGDLIAQAMSTKTDERNDAKRQLKRAYLDEFKRDSSITEDDVKALYTLGKRIGRKFHNKPA